MYIRLSKEEKKNYCIMLGQHMKRSKAIAGFNQDVPEDLCEISKERIPRIGKSGYIMRWSQFMNQIIVFIMNTT